jgi:MoaA/NifB/PqqE/SkfB family radical SAM enzyme
MRESWSQAFRKELLARAMWRRTTPLRLRNLIRSEAARRVGAKRLASLPVTVMVAPTSACNLRCRFCVVGQRSAARPEAQLSVPDYEALVGAVAAHAYCVQLYVYGEPTLHPRLPDLVRIAASRGLYTSTSTNATLLDYDLAQALVAAGLDNIVVSVDGATQGTYEAYRGGGKLADAVRGVRRLAAARRALGSGTPVIEWRTIVFRHNEHELPDMRRLAAASGADVFRPVPAYVEDPEWAAMDRRYRTEAYRYVSQDARGCQWPYRRLVVHADGGVSPCCWAYPQPFDFGHIGDIPRMGIEAVWNAPPFRASRAVIAGAASGADEPAAGPATVCVRCAHGEPPSRWDLDGARRIVAGGASVTNRPGERL